ncbi:DUF5786 family protein [Halobacteria archaeon AArc-m2/3/4]|uniref:DUF5786 family protein n=1 Tax=Natronoglomus mannanivorans TaxID=2979990 RepID=A0AAP2Z036_9EURY|nr:DUF5786 family protein [Halovivax sp. TS33]MCU4742751.1 DUF5786 family protein [Halobacteria archaeon AArc-xg1-1]MCU4974230.1 DUF5786 family protein [Halobacteria archaeon AArc-m2/3/4]
MGFGSYDESEQQHQTQDDEDDVDAVKVHEHDHQGSVEFESDLSTDELVSQLGSMKDDADDE